MDLINLTMDGDYWTGAYSDEDGYIFFNTFDDKISIERKYRMVDFDGYKGFVAAMGKNMPDVFFLLKPVPIKELAIGEFQRIYKDLYEGEPKK